MGMDHLHESILIQVLSRLDTRAKVVATGVTREWKQLLDVSNQWGQITLNTAEDQQRVTVDVLMKLIERADGNLEALGFARSEKAAAQANVARFAAKIRCNQALPHTLGKHAERLALLCTNLMYLRLDERTAPIGGMTDHFALALSARCRQLRFLELAFKRYSRPAELFTDAGMVALAQAAPQLRVLRLHSANAVGDQGLAAVGRFCPALLELQLCGYNELISDTGICALLAGCRGLKVMLIDSRLDRVRDASLEQAAISCPALQEVQLSSGITDRGLQALVEGCRGLSRADLRSCRLLSGCPL